MRSKLKIDGFHRFFKAIASRSLTNFDRDRFWFSIFICEHQDAEEERKNGIPHIPENDTQLHEENAEDDFVEDRKGNVDDEMKNVDSFTDEKELKRQIVIDEESEDATGENFAEELKNDEKDDQASEKDEGQEIKIKKSAV